MELPGTSGPVQLIPSCQLTKVQMSAHSSMSLETGFPPVPMLPELCPAFFSIRMRMGFEPLCACCRRAAKNEHLPGQRNLLLKSAFPARQRIKARMRGAANRASILRSCSGRQNERWWHSCVLHVSPQSRVPSPFKPDARRGAPTVGIIKSVRADLYELAPEAEASLQSLA